MFTSHPSNSPQALFKFMSSYSSNTLIHIRTHIHKNAYVHTHTRDEEKKKKTYYKLVSVKSFKNVCTMQMTSRFGNSSVISIRSSKFL